MATTVRMPAVLANVTEAAIQSWSVGVGDTVAVGQPFAEIETDKAVVEYAAETAGTVLQLLVAEGDQVDVGAPIAVIGEPGEAVAGEAAGVGPAAMAQHDGAHAAAASSDSAGSVGSADSAERRFISPIARRIAREHGIDLDGVTGTGPSGRIVRRDLERLIATGAPSAEPAPPLPQRPAGPMPPSAEGRPEPELIPHSRMRTTIARRLTDSKNEVPHFYMTADCRVDRLLALRRELNAADNIRVSVNDLVVKAVAGAFLDVPEANRIWSDDGMLHYRTVDIAIAVSLDDGLVTPVLRGVERLSVTELGRQIVDLAERARSGRLRQHEIEGGTFTVSNLGMFGTQAFSAIINPPQSGILAVGAARSSAVVVDGVVEAGTVMTVTLSVDHRALDGALAARWLAAFVARIEHPLTILA